MSLPVGKLPPELLTEIITHAPIHDGRVLLGPGIGLDCAVVEHGEQLLVFKSDPITFTADQIGWYAVQVNANDIATTGAEPRWLLVTALLPEGSTTPELVRALFDQVKRACDELRISLIGGHTEVTNSLDRPILVGTLVGEVAKERLVTPRGIRPGDRLLLTKGVPIEATAILARDISERLVGALTLQEIETARRFLYDPGLSVVRDAQVAMRAGTVTGMHDPTEGGLYAAVWEMAEASGCSMTVDLDAVYVPELSKKICNALGIDPLGAIASGALLLASPPLEAGKIKHALNSEGITCAEIGRVEEGPASASGVVEGERSLLPHPARDEISRVL